MARTQGLTLTRNNRGLLLIALLAGLVAAVLVFVAVANSGSDGGSGSTPGAITVKAVVAGHSIAAGTEITAEMLKVVEVPENLLVAGAYNDSGLVAGQVTRVALSSGEQITPGKLGSAARQSEAGIASVVDPPNRGFSFGVQEVTAVGGLMIPGDRVDIVVTYKIKNVPGLLENEYIQRTEVILQNVEILSVAQLAQDPKPVPDAESGDAGDTSLTSGDLPDDVTEQPQAGTVTVHLDAEQALKLASFQDNPATVRIWSVLRGFGDSNILDIAPFDVIVVE